jgi:hypothetical protein
MSVLVTVLSRNQGVWPSAAGACRVNAVTGRPPQAKNSSVRNNYVVMILVGISLRGTGHCPLAARVL